MGRSASLFTFLVIAIIAVHLVPFASVSAFDLSADHRLLYIPVKSECSGSIAECMMAGGDTDEFEMDSEINRRILASRRYISYGALSRNSVPCSRRGASYYNCRSGAQANPYSRGCSRITRCRS